MRTKRMTLLAALAAALFSASIAEAAKPDSWITAKVKSRLAAAKDVSAFSTNVDTRGGVVTLRGEVDTEAEKTLAGKYAAAIEGVRRVDNKLIVRGDSEREDTGVFDRGGDSAAEGDPRDEVEEKGWGDKALGGIDDAAITARVKSALAGTRGTKALKTNVTTREGEVTLTGTVRSESERELAEEVANGVNGVKSVDNQLKVR